MAPKSWPRDQPKSSVIPSKKTPRGLGMNVTLEKPTTPIPAATTQP